MPHFHFEIFDSSNLLEGMKQCGTQHFQIDLENETSSWNILETTGYCLFQDEVVSGKEGTEKRKEMEVFQQGPSLEESRDDGEGSWRDEKRDG